MNFPGLCRVFNLIHRKGALSLRNVDVFGKRDSLCFYTRYRCSAVVSAPVDSLALFQVLTERIHKILVLLFFFKYVLRKKNFSASDDERFVQNAVLLCDVALGKFVSFLPFLHFLSHPSFC